MLKTTDPELRFVVAVHPEARPLVDHYSLRRDLDSRFPLYEGEFGIGENRYRICLIVSGVGKTAAATATGFLAASRPASIPIWVNVGIAGHRDQTPGSAYAAHRIRDFATGRSYFPGLVACRMESKAITTVDRPERSFQTDDLFEMEASGYFEAALHFSTTELIQCFKIVSDNRLNPADGLTKDAISGLVAGRTSELDAMVGELIGLAREATTQAYEPSTYAAFTKGWHFTRSQRMRLHHLLRRAELMLEETLEPTNFAHRASASEVLSDLEELVEAAVLRRFSARE